MKLGDSEWLEKGQGKGEKKGEFIEPGNLLLTENVLSGKNGELFTG